MSKYRGPCDGCKESTSTCRGTCDLPREWAKRIHDYRFIDAESPILRNAEKALEHIPESEKKRCDCCHKIKTLDKFDKHLGTPDFRMGICKMCAAFGLKHEIRIKARQVSLDMSGRDNIKAFRILYMKAFKRGIRVEYLINELLKKVVL